MRKIQFILFIKILYNYFLIGIQIKKWNLIKCNKTPLHIAIENKSDKIGELLISKGADINAKDIIHQNILYLFLIIIIEIK